MKTAINIKPIGFLINFFLSHFCEIPFFRSSIPLIAAKPANQASYHHYNNLFIIKKMKIAINMNPIGFLINVFVSHFHEIPFFLGQVA